MKISAVLSRIKRNIAYMIHHDISHEMEKFFDLLYRSNGYLSDFISNYQRQIAPFNDYHSQLALSYVRETGQIDLIPYHMKECIKKVKSGICNGFPFVEHKGKNLYFPKSWDLEKVESFYTNYLNNERIINIESGIGPHQYQSEDFKIEDNDILVDVGCAEALLALDVIDRIKCAYLIENDPIWFEPLKKTFQNHSDKIKLITKTVCDIDDEENITLDTLLKGKSDDSIFIKMDIEGGEMNVLTASEAALMEHHNIKIACCTYHRVNDADNISNILDKLGYHYSFSTGYILTSFLDPTGIPSLRKGVIRARK